MIVFWSPLEGKGNVTVATAITAMFYQKVNDKGNYLISTTNLNESLSNYFASRLAEENTLGIRNVTQLLSSGKFGPEGMYSSTTNISGTSLELLDWEKVTLVDEIMNRVYVYIDSIMSYQQSFIDLGSGPLDDLRSRFVEKADHVVICLSQEMSNLTSLLKAVNALKEMGKRILFLVGSYDQSSKLNKRVIATALSVKASDIFFIPYITGVKNYCYEQDLVALMKLTELEPKKFLFETNPVQILYNQMTSLIKQISGGVK